MDKKGFVLFHFVWGILLVEMVTHTVRVPISNKIEMVIEFEATGELLIP